MKNSDFRNLVPGDPDEPPSGPGTFILKCGLAFALGTAAVAAYINPGLLQLPAATLSAGIEAAKKSLGSGMKPPASVAGSKGDVADDAVNEPLTMFEENTAYMEKLKKKEPVCQGIQSKIECAEYAYAQQVNRFAIASVPFIGMSGGPTITLVKLYLGGAPSRAMVTACQGSDKSSITDVDRLGLAAARFADCYLTTNTARLCDANQKRVLVEVIDHYFATRAYWMGIFATGDIERGHRPQPANFLKPADWDNNFSRNILPDLRRLISQGYIARKDFGWFPDEALKNVLDNTKTERDACAARKV